MKRIDRQTSLRASWGRGNTMAGFTIVELLIVIIVIGILAALVLVAFNGASDQAHIASIKSDLNETAKALEFAKQSSDGEHYPQSLSGTTRNTPQNNGTTLTYVPGSSSDAKTYCLTGQYRQWRYYVTNTVLTPTVGDCPATSGPANPGGGGTPAPNPLQTGLVAWWPFNGDATDVTGNGNDGTVIGATLTTGQGGSPNTAYSFNGSSNYITSNKPILNNLTTYSFGGWMYYTSGQSTRAGFAGQNDNVENFFYNGTDSRFYQGGATTSCVYLAQSQWHFIYITFDGSTTKQYADGSQCDSSASGSHSSSSSSFTIGGGGVSEPTGNFFNGKIDDIRIYDRALSASDIQNLYTNGAH